MSEKEKEAFKTFLLTLNDKVLAERDRKEKGIVHEEEILEIYEQLNSDFPHVATNRIKEFSEYLEKQHKDSNFDYIKKFKVTKKLIDGLNYSISQHIEKHEEEIEFNFDKENAFQDEDNGEDNDKEDMNKKTKEEEKQPENKRDEIEIRNESISSLFLSLIIIPLIKLIIDNDKNNISEAIPLFLEYYHPFDLDQNPLPPIHGLF